MKSGLKDVSVLIIDDNTHMIKIVKTILKGFGVATFFEATDAADAFDLVRTNGPDIIIVDYQMNLLDGVDFVRLVRTGQDVSNPYVPIIMLTAYSERKRVLAARDAGITEFCCKPVTAEELYKKFCSIINSPRQFVRTSSYFGPDRRRHDDTQFGGPFLRKTDERCGAGEDVAVGGNTQKTLDFTSN